MSLKPPEFIDGFAHLFPQSSSIIHFNGNWITYDDGDVGCRVRKKFASELQFICTNFLKIFYSEIDASVSVKNFIALDSKIQRNQRTSLLLVGIDKEEALTEKLSCVARFVGARVQ